MLENLRHASLAPEPEQCRLPCCRSKTEELSSSDRLRKVLLQLNLHSKKRKMEGFTFDSAQKRKNFNYMPASICGKERQHLQTGDNSPVAQPNAPIPICRVLRPGSTDVPLPELPSNHNTGESTRMLIDSVLPIDRKSPLPKSDLFRISKQHTRHRSSKRRCLKTAVTRIARD